MITLLIQEPQIANISVCYPLLLCRWLQLPESNSSPLNLKSPCLMEVLSDLVGYNELFHPLVNLRAFLSHLHRIAGNSLHHESLDDSRAVMLVMAQDTTHQTGSADASTIWNLNMEKQPLHDHKYVKCLHIGRALCCWTWEAFDPLGMPAIGHSLDSMDPLQMFPYGSLKVLLRY